MAQNSNISISSVAARFINAPIGRKKRAVSSKKPETYRLTHREENKSKKRPQTAPTARFPGKDSTPVSRESTPDQRARAALRGGQNTTTWSYGSSLDVFWKHPSRRLSWTDEMREAARQKALKRYRKEEKL